jgi:hypothetical protein
LTKIAIYGDSFAADYEGWPKYFSELMGHEVTTFGKKGSSVGYSYLKFLETHEKYDMVYFLWTSFDREWLISPDEEEYELKHYCSFQPSKDLETIFKSTRYNPNMPSPAGRIKWHPKQDIEKWIINEHNNFKFFPCKNLINVLAMKDSVKLKRPDCKNIETINYVQIQNKIDIPGMIRIELQDMMQFSKGQWLDEIPRKRLNHLTAIQNEEFSSHLYSSFLNDTDIHKTFKNPKKYYTMSKTLEESGFELT